MTKPYFKKSRRDFVKTSFAAGSLAFFPWNISGANLIDSNTGTKEYTPGQLKDMGILDVTVAPYFADPNAEKDSTSSIQKAVNDARDQGLVCFFPEGTYLISDMISAKQEITPRKKPYTNAVGTRHFDAIRKPMILMGSTKGKRPVIKLSADAKGYDDPSNPKKAIWIWAQGWFDAPGKNEPVWGKEQGNINFNHIFMNIDIDIKGHAGAIGIRHSGSQGSCLLNSTIYAEGALSGMSNCCGQGGGTYNMEVIGGDYGIMIDKDSRFPLLASCIFRGQTKSSVFYNGPRIQVPSVFTGCSFAPAADIAVDIADTESHVGLLFVDCIFDLDAAGKLVSCNKKENIYIENSYVRAVENIYTGGDRLDDTMSWKHVKILSVSNDSGEKMLNGKEESEDLIEIDIVQQVPDYREIHKIHFKRLPSFEDDDAVNVRDYGAVGDGSTDDTEAFKKAIATHDKIFVPKGYFKLSGELKLGKKTQIFGLSRNFTAIGNGGMGRNGLEISRNKDASDFQFITEDNTEAAPGVVFLSLGGIVSWKSGKGVWFLSGGLPDINSNGGGQFYGCGAMGRFFKLEGINHPTTFYALNVERVKHEPQSEFLNCKNVKIFYFKVEAGSRNSSIMEDLSDANTPCIIRNSENISVYCMTGVVIKLKEQHAMIKVVDSENIKIVQTKSFQPGDFPQVREIKGKQTFEIPAKRTASLFIRN